MVVVETIMRVSKNNSCLSDNANSVIIFSLGNKSVAVFYAGKYSGPRETLIDLVPYRPEQLLILLLTYNNNNNKINNSNLIYN